MVLVQKVFVVNGRGGCGKSTWEQYVQQLAAEQGFDVYITSMVKYTKDIAESVFYWSGSKSLKERRFLSDLKDTLDKYCNYNRVNVANDIGYHSKADAIFVDAREPDDIDWLKTTFNATTILITRNETISDYGNHADDNVNNYDYDVIIENLGTLNELKYDARVFFNHHIKNECPINFKTTYNLYD